MPNGVGALLGCIYLALICLFPRKLAKRGSPSASEGDTPSRRELMRGTSGEAEAETPADGSADGHALGDGSSEGAEGGGKGAAVKGAAAAAGAVNGLSIPAEAGDLQLARAV